MSIEELIKLLRELSPEEFGNAWDFAFACQQAMNEAADAIEELQKPQWISVEDRLPEKEKGKYWSDEVLVWDGESEFIACYGGLQDTWTANTRITHWMKKPSPPKPVSNPDKFKEET